MIDAIMPPPFSTPPPFSLLSFSTPLSLLRLGLGCWKEYKGAVRARWERTRGWRGSRGYRVGLTAPRRWDLSRGNVRATYTEPFGQRTRRYSGDVHGAWMFRKKTSYYVQKKETREDSQPTNRFEFNANGDRDYIHATHEVQRTTG